MLCYLDSKTDKDAQRLFWGIIFWLASAIDNAGTMADAPDNPLQQPKLVGVKGRRFKISAAFKAKVCRKVARGDVFHSPDAVLKGFGIVEGDVERFITSANKWQEPFAFQYLHNAQEAFHILRVDVQIYAVASDATSLSGHDTVVTAVWNAGLEQCCWAPPQA